MIGVAGRALLSVLVPIALAAVALQAVAYVLGAALPSAFFLASLALLALAALVGFALLAPVRADLGVVRSLINVEGQLAAALAPEAHAEESRGLLAAVTRLRASFMELEQEVSRARREIEDAEQLRIRFLAAMGHDLRGPLNAIIGFSDMLVMEGLDAVTAAQRPSVEIIRRAASDLMVLLEAILEWAKYEAGQVALELAPASLDDIIAEVAAEARRRSADRGLVVQTSVASDLPLLTVDHARIAQALLGLLDHATRAPDRPRVTVSAWLAKDERGRASARIELRDPQLVVREGDHSSFFEAFRPSYAPSGKRVAGLGLGPALGRTLVRAHGGEVWFASQADTGTTFVVDLPLSAQDEG